MKEKMKMVLFWAVSVALPVVTYFGFRCPAPGCPGCKLVGK